jgi:hypothetical protein
LRHKWSIGPYLAFLSVKYEVAPEKFFSALIKAVENRKSNCGPISIRGEINAKRIFLITNNTGVLVQFRVPEELYWREIIRLENSWKPTRFLDIFLGRGVRPRVAPLEMCGLG